MPKSMYVYLGSPFNNKAGPLSDFVCRSNLAFSYPHIATTDSYYITMIIVLYYIIDVPQVP